MTAKLNKAKLLVNEKWVAPNGLIREIIVWEVPTSTKYQDGVRYRMVLADPMKTEVLVLLDNHPPKGHHQHHFGKESVYRFEGLSKLLT